MGNPQISNILKDKCAMCGRLIEHGEDATYIAAVKTKKQWLNAYGSITELKDDTIKVNFKPKHQFVICSNHKLFESLTDKTKNLTY